MPAALRHPKDRGPRRPEPDVDPLALETHGPRHRDAPVPGVADRDLGQPVRGHRRTQRAQPRRHAHRVPEPPEPIGERLERQEQPGLVAQFGGLAADHARRAVQVPAIVRPGARLTGVSAGGFPAVRAPPADERLGQPLVAPAAERQRLGARHQHAAVVQLVAERLDELRVPRCAPRLENAVEPHARVPPYLRDPRSIVIGHLLGLLPGAQPLQGHVALVVVHPGGHQHGVSLGREVAAQDVARDVRTGHMAQVKVAVRRRGGSGHPGQRCHACSVGPGRTASG
jgi:hypothetical protein